MTEEKNSRFTYVRKTDNPLGGLLNRNQKPLSQPGQPLGQNPELGKLRSQLRNQTEPLIRDAADRLENRLLRVKSRLSNVVGRQTQQKEEPPKEIKYCPSCNSPVELDQRFCPMCGAPLNIEARKELEHKENVRRSRNMSVEV